MHDLLLQIYGNFKRLNNDMEILPGIINELKGK